jgi:hypothetical protein
LMVGKSSIINHQWEMKMKFRYGSIISSHDESALIVKSHHCVSMTINGLIIFPYFARVWRLSCECASQGVKNLCIKNPWIALRFWGNIWETMSFAPKLTGGVKFPVFCFPSSDIGKYHQWSSDGKPRRIWCCCCHRPCPPELGGQWMPCELESLGQRYIGIVFIYIYVLIIVYGVFITYYMYLWSTYGLFLVYLTGVWSWYKNNPVVYPTHCNDWEPSPRWQPQVATSVARRGFR